MTAVVAAALALVVAGSYASTLDFEFLACDDDVNVTDNPVVQQGLSSAGARWALTTARGANWHPLTWLSHMADVELFALDAGGHHATSVALHAGTAVLLFLALHWLTGAFWRSAAVAALFAFHPLRVESVAWVAERKDVLSGFFFSATLLAWAAYCARPGPLRYAAVALMLALGLASKPMLVTLPLVLLLLDFWPLARRRSPAALVVEKLPLLVIAALGSAAALWSQRSGGAVASLEALSLSDRLSNAVTAYALYLGKTLWPADLAVFYPHPAFFRPAGDSPFDFAFFASAGLLLALSALALRERRRRPYLAVGWFWYLGMLLPVIGLVHIGQQGLADRYTYLPAIGVAIAGVFALGDAVERRPGLRLPIVALSCLALLAYSVVSWRQVQHWRTTRTLFEHVLAVTQNNYFAHNHLGRHYENAGQPELAKQEYERALMIYERDASAHANLGNVLAAEGEYAGAVAHIERAIALDPGFAKAYNSLGVARDLEGRLDLAAAAFERALALDPQLFSAHFNYSSVLFRRGDADAALYHLQRATEIDPGHVEAANNLGVAYVRSGRVDAALPHYRRALSREPLRADVLCNLGIALEKAGSDEALAVYRRALLGGVACVAAHRALARHWTAKGDPARALRHFQAIARQFPENAAVRNDLALAYLRAGARARARSQFEQVLRLDPDNAQARSNLAQLERAVERAPNRGSAE